LWNDCHVVLEQVLFLYIDQKEEGIEELSKHVSRLRIEPKILLGLGRAFSTGQLSMDLTFYDVIDLPTELQLLS
jgi:hypothetical protein